MTENDPQHRAFEAFCAENGLDTTMHPLHLLYLHAETQKALNAFKAGWNGSTYARNAAECEKRGIAIPSYDCHGSTDEC